MNQLLVGIAAIAGATLQALILHDLFAKGIWRKYPVFSLNVVVLFITGIVDAALYNFHVGTWAQSARVVYWIDDSIRQVFLFILVLSLVPQAMEEGRKRGAVQRLLVLGSITLAVASYFALSDPRISVRMSAVIRNMSFSAAILNLGLWAALIRTKQRDGRILMISGGLGLQITGEAMGHSLRNLWQISRVYANVGTVVLILAHLLCLLVWWQAFRRESKLDKSRPDSPKGAPRRRTFDAGTATGYTGKTFQGGTPKSVHPRPVR